MGQSGRCLETSTIVLGGIVCWSSLPPGGHQALHAMVFPFKQSLRIRDYLHQNPKSAADMMTSEILTTQY
jgi:hypothetical protein